jgi:hypothetical protein
MQWLVVVTGLMVTLRMCGFIHFTLRIRNPSVLKEKIIKMHSYCSNNVNCKRHTTDTDMQRCSTSFFISSQSFYTVCDTATQYCHDKEQKGQNVTQ